MLQPKKAVHTKVLFEYKTPYTGKCPGHTPANKKNTQFNNCLKTLV